VILAAKDGTADGAVALDGSLDGSPAGGSDVVCARHTSEVENCSQLKLQLVGLSSKQSEPGCSLTSLPSAGLVHALEVS
jgi:hypothetical protein